MSGRQDLTDLKSAESGVLNPVHVSPKLCQNYNPKPEYGQGVYYAIDFYWFIHLPLSLRLRNFIDWLNNKCEVSGGKIFAYIYIMIIKRKITLNYNFLTWLNTCFFENFSYSSITYKFKYSSKSPINLNIHQKQHLWFFFFVINVSYVVKIFIKIIW